MSSRRWVLTAAAAAAIGVASHFVAGWEGERFAAYPDSGGVWTICSGHTKGVKPGDTATKAQCEEYLRQDLEEAAAAVTQCVKVPMPQNQWVAWISFAYNVGRDAFCRSTAVKLINMGESEAACNQLARWVYDDSKDCRIKANGCFGIVRRRMAEYQMCWPDFSNVIGGVA